jgi:hypothetical protein
MDGQAGGVSLPNYDTFTKKVFIVNEMQCFKVQLEIFIMGV